MNKRKLKLLGDGVKLTIKELVTVKKWIIVEIFLMLVELIVWILLIYNNISYSFLFPLITTVYISFFMPSNKTWWKSNKSCYPIKKITNDVRYIYIFSHNDREFSMIMHLMYILPFLALMVIIQTGTINTYLIIESNIEYEYFTISTILSLPFQVIVILWMIFRLVYLKRFREISDLFSNKIQTEKINNNV